MPKKFDLEADVKADPPKVWKAPSPLDHPRMQEWLHQLLSLRATGHAVTNRYIAEKLTKGGRLEGIIPPAKTITENAVRVHLWRRSSREQV